MFYAGFFGFQNHDDLELAVVERAVRRDYIGITYMFCCLCHWPLSFVDSKSKS